MKVERHIEKLYCIIVFLVSFSLPFYYTFNNWILGVFYFLSIILFIISKEDYSWGREKFKYICLNSSFFFITLFGMLYSENRGEAVNDLVQAIPFLITPLVLIGRNDFFKKYSVNLFFGLVLGCLFSLFICWGHAVQSMIINNEPISYFFRWRHMNHQLTEIVGIHPSYLSLFIVFSIALIISKYDELNKRFKILSVVIILLFSIFLFSLLARTVLFFYTLSVVIYLLVNKKWQLFLPFIIIFSSFVVLVMSINDENDFLREKIYYQIPFLGHENNQDARFKRLGATKYMFLKHPVIGVGTADSKDFRLKYYLESGDTIAYDKEYNAHNQFFEYLDEFGIIGGVLYLLLFIMAVVISWKKRDFLFLYLTLLTSTISITESILQKTHGIIFFSLFFSLFFGKYVKTYNKSMNSADFSLNS